MDGEPDGVKTMLAHSGLQLRRGMHVASTRRDVGECGRVDRQTFWCGAGGCGAVLAGWLRVLDRVMVV